jgi:hypothetical protein
MLYWCEPGNLFTTHMSHRLDWMSEEEHAQCPEPIEICLVDVITEQPGCSCLLVACQFYRQFAT